MRPKNLSTMFVSVTILLQYALKKIEDINIFPDLVVVATKNFPFRSSKIFETMINKIIKNNYDIVICDKNRKVLLSKIKERQIY